MGRSARKTDCCPDLRHYARGLCKTHYREWQRRKNGIGVSVAKVCPVCLSEFSSLWGRMYCGKPCKDVASKWKNRFGLTPEGYHQLLASQGGRCATCPVSDPKQGDWRNSFFDVDHCHTSGQVRGLLCRQCNVILGYSRDNATVLRNLADYLERHAKELGRTIHRADL